MLFDFNLKIFILSKLHQNDKACNHKNYNHISEPRLLNISSLVPRQFKNHFLMD